MTIKAKLITLGGITLLALLTLFGLMQYQQHQTNRIGQATQLTQELNLDLAQLRYLEKGFLDQRDLTFKQGFDQQSQQIQHTLQALHQLSDALGLGLQLEQLGTTFSHYQDSFSRLVELQTQIGLTPKQGLYGALRGAVHDAEEIVREQRDTTLLAGILMLRRAEKDFMLRRDASYLGKFESSLSSALAGMEMSRLSSHARNTVTQALNAYSEHFRNLVNAEQQVGLSANDGLRGELHQAVEETQQQLASNAQITTAVLASTTTALERMIWSVFSLTSLTLLGLMVWIGRGILRPVQTLAAKMQLITETHDLKIRVDDAGRDELALMAGHFNAMLQSFQHTVQEVLSASDQMSAAAEELSAITTQTSSGVEQQRQEIEQVATALYQMGSTLEEVASNTERAAHSAQEADRRANHGIEVVDKSIQRVFSMAEHAKRAAEVVTSLEEKSERIGAVLGVIKTIAEQTNLLALNAAIEAARAGDQGRGFAVVADEVRGLAKRTQESAAEIESMIHSLNQGTQNVVSVIQESSVIAEESVLHARDASSSLTEIMAAISQILTMSTQIAAATEEQATVANDINKNVANIRTVTDESSAAAQQSAVAGCQVAEQAHRLHDSVRLFTA